MKLSEIRTVIKAELKQRKMSQRQLAAATGFSEKHISQILTGKVDGTQKALDKILEALGLEIVIRVKPVVTLSEATGQLIQLHVPFDELRQNAMIALNIAHGEH